jgi:hypothetical protein
MFVARPELGQPFDGILGVCPEMFRMPVVYGVHPVQSGKRRGS